MDGFHKFKIMIFNSFLFSKGSLNKKLLNIYLMKVDECDIVCIFFIDKFIITAKLQKYRKTLICTIFRIIRNFCAFFLESRLQTARDSRIFLKNCADQSCSKIISLIASAADFSNALVNGSIFLQTIPIPV